MVEGGIMRKIAVSIILVFVFVAGAVAEDQIFVGEGKNGETEVTTVKPKDWKTPHYRHIATKGERRKNHEEERGQKLFEGPIGGIHLGPGYNQSFSPGTVSK
jgi:hypothetical protein